MSCQIPKYMIILNTSQKGMIGDYAKLYKPNTQCRDFEIDWLDHMRCAAENGTLLATSPAWKEDRYIIGPSYN